MKVKELVESLLLLDQELEINFTFGAESGRSFMYGHSGDLMDFEMEEGKVIFSLDFEEDNCDYQ
tara:strand:- start:203 stop:394 length:192 start_codon:yes stop_codon:yes gene_type:complete